MPFKNAAEKRKYILDHKVYFDALHIELTDQYVKDLVNDTLGYEEYYESKKYEEDFAEKKRVFREIFGATPAMSAAGFNRMLFHFVDVSGTPEAKWNNEYLKKIVTDPENGPRKFADMCCKKILDFDDSLLAKSSEEIEKYVLGHRAEIFHLFGNVEFVTSIKKLYDMKKPEDAAIVNAVMDKYLVLQGLQSYAGKFAFKASKLSLILPKDVENHYLELLGAAMTYSDPTRNALLKAEGELRNDPENEELKKKVAEAAARHAEPDKEVQDINNLSPYSIQRPEVDARREISVELLKRKLIGKEGKYHRAFMWEEKIDPATNAKTTEKKYLSKEEVYKIYASKKDIDKIQVEPVVPEARKAIDKFSRETFGFEEKPLWPDIETKRKYLTAVRESLKVSGYNMSDKEFEDTLKKNDNDISILRDKELADELTQPQAKYSFDSRTKITNADRLAGAMYIKGDSEEVKQWNDTVSMLAQNRDGIVQMLNFATKKLLTIDMSILAESNVEKRVQYLREHPVERQLAWIADNLIVANRSLLSEEAANKDPIIKALEDRKLLLESLTVDHDCIKFRGGRIVQMLPDDKKLTKTQVHTLCEGGVSIAMMNTTDPEMAAIYKEFMTELLPFVDVADNILYKNKTPDTRKELFNKGLLSNGNLFKRAYIEETTKTAEGGTVTTKKYYTLGQMVDAVANDSATKDEDRIIHKFKFEDISTEDKEAIEKFIAETPDTVEVKGDEREKNRLRQMRDLRTLRADNNNKIYSYSDPKRNDDTLEPELRELYNVACGANTDNRAFKSVHQAFKYINEHREYSSNPLDQEKLDIALTTLAMLDGQCAKALINRINLEREFGGLLPKPQIDLEKVLSKTGVEPGNIVDKEIYNFRNPFDKRIHNIKEIYEHLKNDLDPWYHKNGDEFKSMLQSMKNILDYASTSKSADVKTMEEMFKEVKEASKTYIESNDAKHSLGQNRRSAALAMVAALDSSAGQELLASMANNKKWVSAVVKEVAKKYETDPAYVTSRDILKKETQQQSLNKEEVLAQMEADIASTKEQLKELDDVVNGVNLDENVAEEEVDALQVSAELAAECIVKENIYKSLKENKINASSIIAEMSKLQVKESSEKILKDDIFRSVVNNMKLNQTSRLDNAIDEIESRYVKAMVKAKEEELTEATKENNASKNKEVMPINPENSGPSLH